MRPCQARLRRTDPWIPKSAPFRSRGSFAFAVKQDVQRGPYESVDEFVEQAVSMLHEQEAWLAANRSDIQSKIEEGYASAQRGELLDPDQVHRELANRKRARSTILT